MASLTTTATTAAWSGTGRYNGVAGHPFEASIVDAGSSRKTATDTASLTLYAPDGTRVFSTGTQPLKGGNVAVHH